MNCTVRGQRGCRRYVQSATVPPVTPAGNIRVIWQQFACVFVRNMRDQIHCQSQTHEHILTQCQITLISQLCYMQNCCRVYCTIQAAVTTMQMYLGRWSQWRTDVKVGRRFSDVSRDLGCLGDHLWDQFLNDKNNEPQDLRSHRPPDLEDGSCGV